MVLRKAIQVKGTEKDSMLNLIRWLHYFHLNKTSLVNWTDYPYCVCLFLTSGPKVTSKVSCFKYILFVFYRMVFVVSATKGQYKITSLYLYIRAECKFEESDFDKHISAVARCYHLKLSEWKWLKRMAILQYTLQYFDHTAALLD